MNDNPPPLIPPNPQPGRQPQPPQQSGGGGKVLLGCGLGCLVTMIVCVVIAVVAMNFVKKQAEKFATQFAADEPLALAPPQLSDAEVQDAVQKFNTFRDSMQAGGQPAPLVLSSEEINALIYNHPHFKDLAGSANVSIENDQLNAKVSIDLDSLNLPVVGEKVQGKYFNGEAALSIDMVAGRPAIFLEGLSVNGTPVPEAFMQGLKSENLLKDSQNNPEMKAFFDKIEEFDIENNQLRIIPKSAGAP